MQQQVGVFQLFEGRAKSPDQTRRQVADKTDGVGNNHLTIEGEAQTTGRGIEGSEKQVFGQHFTLGESVKQGRFARIGVTDDGDDRHPGALAFLAALHAPATESFQFVF